MHPGTWVAPTNHPLLPWCRLGSGHLGDRCSCSDKCWRQRGAWCWPLDFQWSSGVGGSGSRLRLPSACGSLKHSLGPMVRLPPDPPTGDPSSPPSTPHHGETPPLSAHKTSQASSPFQGPPPQPSHPPRTPLDPLQTPPPTVTLPIKTLPAPVTPSGYAQNSQHPPTLLVLPPPPPALILTSSVKPGPFALIWSSLANPTPSDPTPQGHSQTVSTIFPPHIWFPWKGEKG